MRIRKKPFQSEYRILKKTLKEKSLKEYISSLFNLRDEIQNCQVPPLALIQEWAESIKNKSNIKCNFFQSASDVTDPRELNPEDKNLMIFDNLLLEKHTKCEFYYVRGRHSNVDCIYLSQNYFRLPRQTIRENSNFICIFKQDEKNINHIYNDHVGEDMSKEEFRKFCLKCWERLHGFAVIDLTSKAHEGKYRNGFDNFNTQSDIKIITLVINGKSFKTDREKH